MEKYVYKHLEVWVKDKIDGTGKKMYEDSRHIHFISKNNTFIQFFNLHANFSFAFGGSCLINRLKLVKVCLK